MQKKKKEKIMNLISYIKKINDKIKEFDEMATNPFTNPDFEYNPFKNAFSQTYVWLDDENSKNTY